MTLNVAASLRGYSAGTDVRRASLSALPQLILGPDGSYVELSLVFKQSSAFQCASSNWVISLVGVRKWKLQKSCTA